MLGPERGPRDPGGGVDGELCIAAVGVNVRARPVVLGVGGLTCVGRHRRAGDVGDRCDVVPVDAVAHAEQQRRRQQGDCAPGRRDDVEKGAEIEHAEGHSSETWPLLQDVAVA